MEQYNWDPVAYLKGLHTRQIMELRRYAHMMIWDDGVWADRIGRQRWITMQQLKDELALREHIPNKKEAKAIRQAKAKFQRS